MIIVIDSVPVRIRKTFHQFDVNKSHLRFHLIDYAEIFNHLWCSFEAQS